MGRKRTYGFLVTTAGLSLALWLCRPAARTQAPPAEREFHIVSATGKGRRPAARAASSVSITGVETEERKIVLRNAKKVERDGYCSPEESPSSYEKSVSRRKRRIFEYMGLEAAARQNPSSCVMALLARTRSDALFYASQSEEIGCRLIRALLLTDQWEGGEDLGKAELSTDQRSEGKAILRQLSAENPGNGFYSLLLLGALTANDPERREEVYRRFLLAGRFESPLRSLTMRLHELGRMNATALMYSVGLTSTVGVPNFKHGMSMAKYFAREGLYPDEFSYFVKRLDERMSEIDRLNLGAVILNLTEDATLRLIAVSGKFPVQELPFNLRQEGWRAYFKRRVLPDMSVFIDYSQNSCEQILSRITEALPEINREQERQFGLL